MNRQPIRKAIIRLSLSLFPVFLLIRLIPACLPLLTGIDSLHLFLRPYQFSFVVCHGLFYAGLVFLWPKILLARLKTTPKPLSSATLKHLINARFYLLAVFLLSEGCIWWQAL